MGGGGGERRERGERLGWGTEGEEGKGFWDGNGKEEEREGKEWF